MRPTFAARSQFSLFLLSLAIGLCPHVAHAQELSTGDLLNKITETYNHISSFSVVAEKRVDFDTDPSGKRLLSVHSNVSEAASHKSDAIQITMMASSTSKAKLLLKDGKKEVVVVSDGNAVWSALPEQQEYTDRSGYTEGSNRASEGIVHLARTTNDIAGEELLSKYETLVITRLQSISDSEPWAKLERSETLKVGKSKKECYVLTIQLPGGGQKQKLWVDKTTFIVWKSVDTTQSVNTGQSGMYDPGVILQTTVTVSLKQIALNPSLDDSNFVFTPPDKAKRVDSLKLSDYNPF